jgi:predicted permease
MIALAVVRALRTLRRTPSFVAITTVTLGVAMGISVSVFALVDGLTHPRISYREPERLFSVRADGFNVRGAPSSLDRYEAIIRAKAIESAAVGATSFGDVVEANGEFDDRGAVRVLSGYFETLGLAPETGRGFSSDEYATGNAAIVSKAFWRRHFSKRTVIGDAVLAVGTRIYPIVGILPRSDASDGVFLPSASALSMANDWLSRLRIIVRLKSGVTYAGAKSEFGGIAHGLAAGPGPAGRTYAITLVPITPDPLGLHPFQFAMLGAAVCVLLIACTNVSALTLARGIARRRDFALRMALGATRGSLAAEVLAEVGAVVVVGSAAGLLLARWGIFAVSAAVPEPLRWLELLELSWSWRTIAIVVALTSLSVLIAGLLPALQATRVQPADPLKESSTGAMGGGSKRLRALVAIELAISLVLMVGATLMTRATRAVANHDFGFDAQSVVEASVVIRAPADTGRFWWRWSKKSPEEFAALLEKIRALPQVEAATTMDMYWSEHYQTVSDEGVNRGDFLLSLGRGNYAVGPDFFRVMGMQVVAGRSFEPGDATGTGAVVLSDSAARILFPSGKVLGHLVKLGSSVSRRPWLPVVGIVRETEFEFYADPDYKHPPAIFASLPDSASSGKQFVVRIRGDAGRASRAITHTLHDAVPPGSPVGVQSLIWSYQEAVELRRFVSGVFVIVGLASLLLGAAGLLSVLSYAVSRRMREFAVRISLGARRADIVRMVLRDGFELTLAGTALGAPFALWTGRLLNDLLYTIHWADAVALVVAEAVLLITTGVALVLPALRASRANPVEILRAT